MEFMLIEIYIYLKQIMVSVISVISVFHLNYPNLAIISSQRIRCSRITALKMQIRCKFQKISRIHSRYG